MCKFSKKMRKTELKLSYTVKTNIREVMKFPTLEFG